MGKNMRWLGGLAATGLILSGLVGTAPATAAPATDAQAASLNQQWIRQPYPLAGSDPDSIAIIQGSTLDAGLIHVQVLSNFGQNAAPGEPVTDVERFQIVGQNVTLNDVDTQLTLATSGVPATAKPAMAWFKANTRFYSGSPAPSHNRFKIVQQPGAYYVAQITPGRVAATAKPFTVRGTNSAATLPATSQTLKMEPNNTFSVSTGGTIPVIRQIPLRVENNDSELHFAKFLPVPASTTPQQAASWCSTGAGLTPGNAVYGIGTMSGGVKTVVETFTIPVGRYIVADFLPNSETGQSNIPTMCKLVRVTS
jgi:hypothetical protein